MTYSVAFDALPEWLARETASSDTSTAILAGHFAIFSAGAGAQDLLDGVDDPPAAAAMLEFTRFSWRLAAGLAQSHPDRPFQFVPLVDDIQFVRPVVSDRSLAERLGAELSRDYLEKVPTLPRWHAQELETKGVSTDRVLRAAPDRWLFSERALRAGAVRHMRRLARHGARNDVASSDNGNTMTVTLPEQGEYCMIHSGHATCAGGYGELVSTLYDRGVRTLIAFVPLRCLGQVALGTGLARHLFGLDGLRVVNVAIPDMAVSSAAVIDEH